MLDAVRRVVEQALAPVGKDPKPVSVMERTGPGQLPRSSFLPSESADFGSPHRI